MTNSRQEKIYNEIVQYYNFADKLINIAEDSKNHLTPEQMEIVESIVENLEKHTDQLTQNFIEFIKNGNSEEVKQTIGQALNNIIVKIEQCRGQIYALCNNPDAAPKS